MDTCSYRELMDWADLWQTEPWGEYAENVRNAHIVTTLANINRDPKKRDKPFTIEDFMLFKPAVKPKTEEGAKVAPETIAWMFAMSRKKNGE